MRTPLPIRSILLLALVVSSAAHASEERDKLSVRPVMLSEHPDNDTHPIYVKEQVVTTLRFEQLVDASKTKMIGWEGRLEPRRATKEAAETAVDEDSERQSYPCC